MSAQAKEQMANGKTRLRTLNPTCFLNSNACREFLLEFAGGTRAHKYTRVSGETLQRLNEHLRAQMIALVRGLPSKGKTI